MLPSIVFVGPTKCGTTWIDSYLRTRPEVALPVAQKETFFFDKVFDRGVDWYADQFGNASGIGVEVAPSLFHKPEARANLARTLPEARIVVVYRDPFDRAVSHYFHYRKAGEPRMSLRAMAEAHPDIIEAGLFAKHIQAWEELFPGRVSVLKYEDLKSDPAAFCAEVCALVGIPYDGALPPELASRSVNAASLPRSQTLARVGRRAAELVRRSGGHGLVNALRKTPLKKILFSGGGGLDEERAQIRDQTKTLALPLEEDRMAFVTARGIAP